MDNGKNNWHNSAGKFARGNPGKPHGSTKNKMRDKIKTFIDQQWQDFPGWFDTLKPAQKIETLLQLFPYAVARLQSVSITDAEGNDLETSGRYSLSKLTETELRQLAAIQEKIFSNEETDN